VELDEGQIDEIQREIRELNQNSKHLRLQLESRKSNHSPIPHPQSFMITDFQEGLEPSQRNNQIQIDQKEVRFARDENTIDVEYDYYVK
jgi:hypothetical protein